MLDPRFVRENMDAVRHAVSIRGEKADLETFIKLYLRRRDILQEVEAMKNQSNTVSREVGRVKKEGRIDKELLKSYQLEIESDDAKDLEKELVKRMRSVSERIKALDEQLKKTETNLEQILLQIPNMPDPEVPIGLTEEENVEVRRWGYRDLTYSQSPLGYRRTFGHPGFPVQVNHWFTFVFYQGEGARWSGL